MLSFLSSFVISKEVKNIPKAVDRLRSIYRLTMRKFKKDTERMMVKQKMNASLNGSLLVQATPRKSKMPPRYTHTHTRPHAPTQVHNIVLKNDGLHISDGK